MKITFFVLLFAATLFCSSLPYLISSNANALADDPIIIFETDPTVTATPIPTPTPTPKPTPGSPLIFGSKDLGETISQFDISVLAKIAVIVLGLVWGITILVTIIRNVIGKKLKS
jgi:hypothetical protein